MFTTIFGFAASVGLNIITDITQSQKDELIATTLPMMEKDLINHTMLEIPAYQIFLQSPYKKSMTGGYEIRFPFVIDKPDNFEWFGLGDSFSPQPKKVLGWGHTTLKQGAGDVTIEDLETWMNSGPGAFINMVKVKTDVLVQSVKETLSQVAWSDGTGSGGMEPIGLTGHLPANPITGTYMGFNRANEFWSRIWYNDGVTVGPHSLTAPTGAAVNVEGAIGDISDAYPLIIDALNLMHRSCTTKGENAKDIFHITDAQTKLWYLQIPFRCRGMDIGVYDGKMNLGLNTPTFHNSPILDDTIENGAIAGEWRRVNTKYYVMYFDAAHFFKWVGPRHPYNALREANYLVVRFQWVNTYPRRQGFLSGFADWQA